MTPRVKPLYSISEEKVELYSKTNGVSKEDAKRIIQTYHVSNCKRCGDYTAVTRSKLCWGYCHQ